jgi:hypothetical protein
MMVSTFGPRILPGRSHAWTAPVEMDLWADLLDRWRTELGEFDSLAIHQRAQSERSGFSLLLIRQKRPLAFIKIACGSGSGMQNEALALQLLSRANPRSFHAPQLLGHGSDADWHYLAMTPLPPRLHRPSLDPPLTEITAEIAASLRPLQKDPRTPSHWQPMHGDLTPWNLRRFRGGLLALIDWEDTRWGPPGADAVLFRASATALGHPLGTVAADPEAIEYWEAIVRARAAAQGRDARLGRDLLAAFAQMRSARTRPH